MSTELTGRVENFEDLESTVGILRPSQWWFHGLLLLLTFLTTTVFGFALARSFSAGLPLQMEWIARGYSNLLHGNISVWSGIRFSIPLFAILLAHEFGHYFACRYWHIDATLPYFLPSPTLFGTLGAFIKIRSPIYLRTALFDIGVSGPIAGFVVLIPFLIIGICRSYPIHGVIPHNSLLFGTPLLMHFAAWLRFPHVPPGHIVLDPMAMAAWAGLLATAINLIPVGQLDGGHILYAIFGSRWHRVFSYSFIAVLFIMGFLYWAWWIWAILIFLFGRRHPLVYDEAPLSNLRLAIGSLALVMFVLSVCVVPVYIT